MEFDYHELANKAIRQAGVEEVVYDNTISSPQACNAGISEKKIICPTPNKREFLYFLCKECGHIALNHYPKSSPVYVQEFEAECYAQNLFLEWGLDFNKIDKLNVKARVIERINNSFKNGLKSIRSEILDWLGKDYKEIFIGIQKDLKKNYIGRSHIHEEEQRFISILIEEARNILLERFFSEKEIILIQSIRTSERPFFGSVKETLYQTTLTYKCKAIKVEWIIVRDDFHNIISASFNQIHEYRAFLKGVR